MELLLLQVVILQNFQMEMHNLARRQLRLQWYPMMGRSDEQRAEFKEAALHENAHPEDRRIVPYEDVRRPDAHRRVWMKKKTRKKLGALGRGKFVGELTG